MSASCSALFCVLSLSLQLFLRGILFSLNWSLFSPSVALSGSATARFFSRFSYHQRVFHFGSIISSYFFIEFSIPFSSLFFLLFLFHVFFCRTSVQFQGTPITASRHESEESSRRVAARNSRDSGSIDVSNWRPIRNQSWPLWNRAELRLDFVTASLKRSKSLLQNCTRLLQKWAV